MSSFTIPSKKSVLTESEVLAAVVKKRNYASAYEMLTQGRAASKDFSSRERVTDRQNQHKTAHKIWQALCKNIQMYLDKGKVYDTCFYGSFARASTIAGETGSSKATNVVYCPGPRAVLKLIENEDNCVDFA